MRIENDRLNIGIFLGDINNNKNVCNENYFLFFILCMRNAKISSPSSIFEMFVHSVPHNCIVG